MILLFFVWYKKYMFWKWILWIPFLWISSTYLTGNSIIFRVTAQESYMSIKYQPWENKNNGNFMVSIHRIPFIVYLTIRVISCIFRFKRGTSLLSVPRTERHMNAFYYVLLVSLHVPPETYRDDSFIPISVRTIMVLHLISDVIGNYLKLRIFQIRPQSYKDFFKLPK